MALAPREVADLPPAPWAALRDALLRDAEERAHTGDELGAARLRTIVDRWWDEQCAWTAAAVATLRVHHEINNALVGVSGNAQLLLMGPAGLQPGVRERVETIVRESRRIEDAVRRVRALRVAIDPDVRPEPGAQHGQR